MTEAFYILHQDLPREGPGAPEDVAWATRQAQLAADARIVDVGCGPGADIATLLEAAPKGHVTALDKNATFIAAARARCRDLDRATILQADMATIANRYDFLWCAGAVYFLGITEALERWRKSLEPRGIIAFSEPVWLTDKPSDISRQHWAGYAAMSDEAGIRARIRGADYETLGTRVLSASAWEAYYGPLEARIATLRPEADDALTTVLDAAEAEIACWRAHRDEFGYLLCVVRPRGV